MTPQAIFHSQNNKRQCMETLNAAVCPANFLFELLPMDLAKSVCLVVYV